MLENIVNATTHDTIKLSNFEMIVMKSKGKMKDMMKQLGGMGGGGMEGLMGGGGGKGMPDMKGMDGLEDLLGGGKGKGPKMPF